MNRVFIKISCLFVFSILFFSCTEKKIELKNEVISYISISKDNELKDTYTSYKYAKLAYKIAKKNSLQKEQAQALILLAKYKNNQNEFSESISKLDSAILISTQIKDTITLFWAKSENLRLVKYLGIEDKEYRKTIPTINSVELNKLDTLLKYELIIQNIFNKTFWEDEEIKDSITISQIKEVIKISLKKKDNFIAKHNLAKAYYALSQVYKKNPICSDSVIFYYQKSIHYDKLLENHQAWSIFTLSEHYLNLFKQEKDSILLDSALKYNDMALFNIQNFQKAYPYHMQRIYLNYYNYNLCKAKTTNNINYIDTAIIFYNKIDDIKDIVYKKNAKYLNGQINEMKRLNLEIKTQKNKITFLIFVVFCVILVSVTVIYIQQVNKHRQEKEKIKSELDKMKLELLRYLRTKKQLEAKALELKNSYEKIILKQKTSLKEKVLLGNRIKEIEIQLKGKINKIKEIENIINQQEDEQAKRRIIMEKQINDEIIKINNKLREMKKRELDKYFSDNNKKEKEKLENIIKELSQTIANKIDIFEKAFILCIPEFNKIKKTSPILYHSIIYFYFDIRFGIVKIVDNFRKIKYNNITDGAYRQRKNRLNKEHNITITDIKEIIRNYI